MSFFSSTVGKKYIMGITGLVWTGFVLSHMAGNMLIFVSPELYNAYGHALVSNKPFLYTAEAVLVLALLVHVITAFSLTAQNNSARDTKYYMDTNGEKGVSFASRTMIFTGSLILVFVIYHLITFKYGAWYTVTYDGVEMRDLHRLIIEVFQNPAYVVGYIVCLLALGLHLSHGVGSMFKSWGFNHPKYTPMLEKVGYLYAVVVTLGFISQPLYVFLQH